MVSGVRGGDVCLLGHESVLMKQVQECISWAHTGFFVPSAASGSGIPRGPPEVSWFTFLRQKCSLTAPGRLISLPPGQLQEIRIESRCPVC